MSKIKMEAASELIKEKHFEAARAVLRTVDHPTATAWLAKLDEIAPADPFQGLVAKRPEAGISSEVAAARTKSYTNAAVVVLILYFVLWLPGLIANMMYLGEARRMEKLAGKRLPGAGALETEVALLGLLPAILGVLFIVFMVLVTPATDAIFRNITNSL